MCVVVDNEYILIVRENWTRNAFDNGLRQKRIRVTRRVGNEFGTGRTGGQTEKEKNDEFYVFYRVTRRPVDLDERNREAIVGDARRSYCI